VESILSGRPQFLVVPPAEADTADLLPALSARQRVVLEAVAGGLSNKEIAREQGLTEGTVKAYVHQLFRKLAVANRTEAARRYYAAGGREGDR